DPQVRQRRRRSGQGRPGEGRRARRARHLRVAPRRARGDRLTMLVLGDIRSGDVAALLARYGLRLQLVPDGAAIPGSYWGEPEAELVGCTVYARDDTPVHSLLHEAAHLIVLPQIGR